MGVKRMQDKKTKKKAVKAFFGVSEREPKRCFARNDFSDFYSSKDWHREQTVVQEYVRGGGGLLSNSFL